MGRLPVLFVARQGGEANGFVLRGEGFGGWFEAGGAVFQLGSARIELRFPGSSRVAHPEGMDRAPERVSFFLGNRPRLWNRDSAPYSGLIYRGLYPGVDLVYRGTRGRLKSEFIVHPGADPASIRLRYRGAQTVRVTPAGGLSIQAGQVELREEAPEVYQESKGRRIPVAGRFRLIGNQVAGFEVASYDRSLPLTIDPEISYSTYLGGSRFDSATAIALDAAGNAYIAGWTESTDFPVLNALQAAQGGSVDAFVAKLNPAGQLVYCTYLGGAGDDRAFGIAVDGAGSAYVTGWTSSLNFPTTAALQPRLSGGRNAFVAKLSPSGNALVYSTYLGGSGYDSGNAIAVDSSGNAYIGGETTSPDFPVHLAAQSSFGGILDGFLVKLDSSGGNLVYSTFLGGRGIDRVNAVAVDSAGSLYATGGTQSADFPLVNPFQPASGGGQDAFVTKLTASGNAWEYSTYLGGSGGTVGFPETGLGIAVDSAGSAYVAGVTSSTNFPVANALQPTLAGGGIDAFVAKLSPLGNSLVFATYLGGSGLDLATGVAVDSAGQISVAGYTTSTDFPVSQATQAQNAGGYDAFLATLDATGQTLTYSTYLGGSGSDSALAVAVSASSLYVAGQTLSYDFPLKQPVQSTNGDGFSGFVTSISLGPSEVLFVPVTPCRLVDTRAGSGQTGLFGPPAIAGGSQRSVPIPAGSCSIPSSAVAYTLNVTAFPSGYLGYLTIWPSGQPMPVVSTLNSWDGRIIANAAIVPAGTAGAVSAYASNITDVTVDITGYFIHNDRVAGYLFFPVTPCRVADTRSDQGQTGFFGPPAFTAASWRTYPVPQSSCGIPSSSVAYSLNLTVLPSGPLGYVTAWQTGQPMPVASVLSSGNGSVVASAAIVPTGTGGAINVFASNATDLIVDINGYFAGASAGTGYQFYVLTPCRIADTRPGQGKSGAFGPPALTGGSWRELGIPQSSCTVPSSAAAYSLNVTVLPRGYLGFLTSWPAGQSLPVVSTLNSWDQNVVANAAIVPAGLNGAIRVYVSNTTDVIVDINGYFAP